MALLIGLWHRLILWVCLSLFPLRGVARPDHGLGSISQYRRDLCQGLCQGLVGHLCLRGLTWRVGIRLIQVARSLLLAMSPQVLLRLGKRGVWGSALLMCQSPQFLQPPHHLHLQLFRLVCFTNILINGEELHPTGLCLIWFGGHHLQLRSHPPLFHDFWQFNVKATAAHHLVIQREVDELLANGATVPSSGGAGFYSSMFVVPKCTGGLQPILNLKHFNHYMHIPSFKIPTLKHVWQLIQCSDYAFSIDLQDVYLYIPIVKHHCHFL